MDHWNSHIFNAFHKVFIWNANCDGEPSSILGTACIVQYVEQGLCNGWASVRLSLSSSVCLIDRQQQRRPVGLLLSTQWGGDIDQ